MTNNFEDRISRQTDEELIRILMENAADYQPAFIEAAKKEFDKRNLSTDSVETIKSVLDEEKELKKMKATESLSFLWKSLTFIFPGMIQVFLYGKLKTAGYDKKANDLKKWTLFGFLFYLTIILLNLLIGR